MTDENGDYLKTTQALTAEVAQALIARGWRLTTAESCTGGNLAAALCAQADTAAFYDTGVVTFSDEAKRHVLQVREETLAVHSAVSEACVKEMSAGILGIARADIAIAISGYAGPEGGEDGTPAGTVWFAWNFRGQTETKRMCFAGDCEAVLAQAVRYALSALGEKLPHWQ
ncbi:2-oxo-tetronate isomerase [Klebsiella quasivariicola]|uniref:2-oxo-tetronate isomerase n=1 Tax=Klebsiella quasivariicola TaxID=2026240 RepID=UPI001CCBF962|nr:2-oxo-tetronate isomerase [Klebsiella quasivariicola]MBZ9579776.1 2-oxo-tetronate isomerase [Klebsiella quasivariicola]